VLALTYNRPGTAADAGAGSTTPVTAHRPTATDHRKTRAPRFLTVPPGTPANDLKRNTASSSPARLAASRFLDVNAVTRADVRDAVRALTDTGVPRRSTVLL